MSAQVSQISILEIPGLKDKIQVQPDGSVVVQGFTTKEPIKISTRGNITIIGAIEADKLVLHGKEIIIHKPVKANTLIIQADILLKNAHTLQAKKMVIAGAGLYENLSLTRAEHLSLEIKKTKNLGTILATKIGTNASRVKAKTRREATVTASPFRPHRSNTPQGQSKTLKPEQIDNFGLICSQEKLSLETSQDIINHPNAEMLCYGDTQFFPNGRFINKAKVLVKGKFIAMAAFGVDNFDTITADAGIQLLCDRKGAVQNSGILQSGKVISVFNVDAFYNHPHARISAEMVRVQSKSIFSNSGLISGSLETVIGADNNILNSKTGNIFSNHQVKVVGLAKLENDGSITGQRSLTTRTVGETLNHPAAQLQSEALTSVSHHLNNHGKMLGTKYLSVTTNASQNAAGGTMGSERTADITVYNDCVNKGKLFARTLSVQAGSLVNQFKDGEIICFDALTLEIQRHLENAHLIQAEGDIKLLAEHVSNLKEAKVKTKASITIQGKETENHGLIHAEKDINLSGHTLQNTNTMQAQNKIHIQAMAVSNTETAALRARDIQAEVCSLENNAAIDAERTVSLDTMVFHNRLKGLILAGEKLDLFAKANGTNAGRIASLGNLQVNAELVLNNLKTGQMVASKDLELLAGCLLENAGQLLGQNVLLKSGCWILNQSEASITAKADCAINSKYILENYGSVTAEGKLAIEALELIRNFSQGLLKAEQAILLVARSIENAGSIISETALSLDAKLILENFRSGVLSAKETLTLVSGAILRQAGVAKAKEISAMAGLLIQTMAGSQMSAQDRLNVLSDFAIEHNGLLVAEHIQLYATQILNLLSDGLAFATGDLILKGSVVANQAKLKANHVFLTSDILINYINGQISVKELLNIRNSNLAINLGAMEAGNARIASHSMVNNGCVYTQNTLLLDIKTLFQQLNTGSLFSNGSLQLSAKEAYLAGLVMAKGMALIKTHHLDYALDTQWVCGQLKLMLQSAFNFTRPLSVQGMLAIQALDRLRINTTLQASQSMAVLAPNLYIESHGLLARENLELDIHYQFQINLDAYCRSFGSLKAKAHTLRNFGEIYAALDMVLEALHSVENTASIIGKREVEIIAPRIKHYQVKGQEKPVIAAGGNCILRGNTEVRDGIVYVQGQLSTLGSFEYHSSDRQTQIQAQKEIDQAAEQAYKEECRQAKRKRKKALFKNLFSLAAGIAITYFVPGGQTVGLTLLRGALSGGVSSLISGRNPLKGAFKEALLAGIGFGINSGFTKLLTKAPFPALVKTSFITTVSKTATASLGTAIEGGKLEKNLASQVAAALINNVIHSHSAVGGGLAPQVVAIGGAINDALITTAVTSAVNHRKLGKDLLWAGINGAVSGLVQAAGAQLHSAIYNAQNIRQAPQNKPREFGLRAFEDFRKSYSPKSGSAKSMPATPLNSARAPKNADSSLKQTNARPPQNSRNSSGHSPGNNSGNYKPLKKGSSLLGGILDFIIAPAYADEMADVRMPKPKASSSSKNNHKKLTPLEQFNAAMILTEQAEDRLSLGMGAGGTVADKALNFQFKPLVKFKNTILETLESNQRHCRALEARHNVPANGSGCHDPLFYAVQLGAYFIPGSPKEVVLGAAGIGIVANAGKLTNFASKAKDGLVLYALRNAKYEDLYRGRHIISRNNRIDYGHLIESLHPMAKLRRDRYDHPTPYPGHEGAWHTQLGTRAEKAKKITVWDPITNQKIQIKKQVELYFQTREFSSNGRPIKDIDFTDHNRPENHPSPHQHMWRDNITGGSLERVTTPKPLELPDVSLKNLINISLRNITSTLISPNGKNSK